VRAACAARSARSAARRPVRHLEGRPRRDRRRARGAADLGALVALRLGHGRCLLDRAAAAQTNGDLRLARQFLREAGDLAPRYAEPWNRQATIAYDARDFTTAIDAIQETLKREPRHFGALTGLGLIYEEMGQTRAALEAYQSALAIHPYYDEARRGVARLGSQVNGTEA
jgi:tetratricopeptide (TPR) repeat protein